jgi:hypothetical protein
MYTIFSDSTGRREGLVLAQGDNRLRLAVRGSKDAVELERSQGRWAIDGGEPVQIEFRSGLERVQPPGDACHGGCAQTSCVNCDDGGGGPPFSHLPLAEVLIWQKGFVY